MSRENKQLLHSSDAERDDIIVDVLMSARVAFRTKALVDGGWNPEFGGSKGPCCLMTYFIGRCMWDFRRIYLRWARERERIAQVEAALLDPEAFFRLLTALPHHGEPETILFSTAFMDLLDAQPAETRAVVRLTCEGYADGRSRSASSRRSAPSEPVGTASGRFSIRPPASGRSGSPPSCTSTASASNSRVPHERA
ncbi:hypothetical protein ACIRPU_43215 [Streptomyces sp. NPDC102259]|uniref:hypothetical protein n=1 Tax=Streptomyces sp. NPDC102259 TaxID=3366148 RepID=UPI003815D590